MTIKQPELISRADFDEAVVRLRLNVSDVAKDTGIPRTYLSEFRNGDRKLRPEHQAKLRDYFEAKGVVFDELPTPELPESPAPTIEVVKAKRFHFPVDDAVSDDTLASVLATIRGNDRKLVDLLTQAANRDDGFFGSGEFTAEALQALRDSHSLLACNYLMVRAVSGWPEIGLSASNDNIAGNTVLAAILDSVRDPFEAAGLIAKAESGAATEAEEGAQ